MSKTEIMKRIETGWQEIHALIPDLPDTAQTAQNQEVPWSIKDILGHVTTWEQESLLCLPVILKGEKPKSYRREYGGIDAFNAQMIHQKSVLSANQIFDEFILIHKKLMRFLETVPEEHFRSGTRFLRRLGWDTFKHYPEHAVMIRKLIKGGVK